MISRINLCTLLLALSLPALAQLPPATTAAIDDAVARVLAETKGPSASIAIVKDGKVAYVQAYGEARLEPNSPARPDMRYKIASNSKQITATAMLLLAEDGKLSLDDPVARFLPDLTRARDVTIRQLLSHTSGYQDYYALDYVAPYMTAKVTAAEILQVWAHKPLDFEPGTKWQYSNTNYTIAGVIIEKLSGKPLIDFLRDRIFRPLGMQSPVDVDHEPWSSHDPLGYAQFALGPLRPIAPEGDGWMYAAGELAMTARDLALWDISLINGSVLRPASLKELTTEVTLKDGKGTGYALGLGIQGTPGHRVWVHTGGASGFLSWNATRPDDRVSVTVLTNGQTAAFSRIAHRIDEILIPSSLELARRMFRDLQQGKLDRSRLTPDANAYFTEQAIADYASSLRPLGEPSEFRQAQSEERGGMTERTYSIKAGGKSLRLSTYWTSDGKIAQYLVGLAPVSQ